MKTDQRSDLADADAPALPAGYRWRPATPADADAVADLLAAVQRDVLGADADLRPQLRTDWQTPGFEPARDVRLIVDPDGAVAAGVQTWNTSPPHVRNYCNVAIRPDQRAHGFGPALLAWAEAHAREWIPLAPPDARVHMGTWLPVENRHAQADLTAAGFTVVRHGWNMRIDFDGPPPAPQVPAGVRLRTLVRPDDEVATVKAQRAAFQDHWGFLKRPLENDLAYVRHFMDHHPAFDPSLWFLADAGGEIVGLALCQLKTDDDPRQGWVDTLGVVRAWRRKGLGLALLQHAFGELYRRGQRHVGLGVDAQNPTGATRLYERAGMYVYRRSLTFEKELRPGRELTNRPGDGQAAAS